MKPEKIHQGGIYERRGGTPLRPGDYQRKGGQSWRYLREVVAVGEPDTPDEIRWVNPSGVGEGFSDREGFARWAQREIKAAV